MEASVTRRPLLFTRILNVIHEFAYPKAFSTFQPVGIAARWLPRCKILVNHEISDDQERLRLVSRSGLRGMNRHATRW